MKAWTWLWSFGTALSWLVAPDADACDAQRPFITIRFLGRHSESFTRAVLADLEAGLARNDVNVCPPEPAGARLAASLAELQVDEPSPQLITLSVRLHAGGVESRLDRQVDLSRMPADSHAFSVALAADELLRAGGVEWLGGGAAAPAASSTVAAAPVSGGRPLLADEADAATAETARWSLGLRPALERFGGGQTLWGADAAVLVPLAGAFELQLAPGIRRGVAVSAPRGRVESSSLNLAAHARYRLIDAGWQLVPGLGLQGARLMLQGSSDDSATTASRLVGFALYAQGVVSASLPIAGSLRFELSGVLGVPLRELEATADGRVATAVSGLQLGALSALWWQL